ncbi:MAG TPA: diaminopimelate epimerase [Pirellulales bacterium]|nr:diaminopimelate epimerase [Pirellulales bacterium]
MRFTKMHGAGNDYVYVDCFAEPIPDDPADLARRIADRHFGVGGDGLILICPSEMADARMRMFNADGSESEMCGNGIRCVAKYIYDHGIARKPQLKIETGNGVLTLDLEIENDRVDRVRVDMGAPILEMAKIPMALPGVPPTAQVVDFPLAELFKMAAVEAAKILPPGSGAAAALAQPDIFEPFGGRLHITGVSMGNPHLVIYDPDVARVTLECYGPLLERYVFFPKRINVHFVQVDGRQEVTMRTWERGSGITLACGTGACAVCVAGVLTGRTDRRILAHLPGGDLELEWRSSDQHVYMTGPAVEVFNGDWNDVRGEGRGARGE